MRETTRDVLCTLLVVIFLIVAVLNTRGCDKSGAYNSCLNMGKTVEECKPILENW